MIIVDEKIYEEENKFQFLKEMQKKYPDLVLPSYGMLDNEEKNFVNGRDYINEKSNEE